MDRQDIDALLIGALYGELTPADEARLAMHLESHPTDRGALDDLKSARQAVRESRIFDLQLDPPQAVSALLLQEAHRRAPRRVVVSDEKESWFFRFTRVFLAHPAMAAAAMLVLVIGVASTLYLRKGDHYADKELGQAPALDNSAEVATAPAETPAPEPGLAEGAQGATGSGYTVRLDDKADGNAARDRASLDLDLAKADQQQKAAAVRAEQKNKKTASNAIVVDTPQRQPKELDAPRAKAAKKGAAPADDFGGADSTFESTVVGGAGGGAGGGAASSGRVATTPPAQSAAPAPPPPPAAAPATVAQTTSKPTATPSKATVAKEAEKSEAKPAPAKDSTLLAWAKGQHASAVARVNQGDCVGAAKLAVAIQNRAPDYYSQYMATDRALKKCQSYIAAERDAEAERSGKARAQKRVNADEPASVK